MESNTWAHEIFSPLGYSLWRRFENAIQKAIESCKQSGNDPSHHFAGAGKQIEFGKDFARGWVGGEEYPSCSQILRRFNTKVGLFVFVDGKNIFLIYVV